MKNVFKQTFILKYKIKYALGKTSNIFQIFSQDSRNAEIFFVLQTNEIFPQVKVLIFAYWALKINNGEILSLTIK